MAVVQGVPRNHEMSKVLRSRSLIRPRGVGVGSGRGKRVRKPLIVRRGGVPEGERVSLPGKRAEEELPEGMGDGEGDRQPREKDAAEKRKLMRTGKVSREKRSRRPGRSRLRTEREVTDDSGPVRPIPARHRARLTISRRHLAAYGFVVAALVVAAFLTGHQVGTNAGRAEAARIQEAAALSAPKQMPPEALPALDNAVALLRDGEHRRALDELRMLASVYPSAPSLDYATALAALSSGDIELATRMAASSAAKNQRTADALALSAAIEGQKTAAGIPSIADPNLRAEEYLRKAVAADPLNPSPRIEMAGIARRFGNTEEAIAHLRAARNLVQPVDSILVIDTTLALLEAQTKPADPSISPLARAFVSALEEAGNGNTAAARTLLETIKNQLPPDTFFYLVNDPFLKKFSYLPELEPFFRGE
jgi:tetratricopeptide (TPR) repeat protein